MGRKDLNDFRCSKPTFLNRHERVLYEQYQAAVRRLFGKRHDLRGVKLTPDQEAAKAESNRLEAELTTTRLSEIANTLNAQHRNRDAERCRQAREATRRELAENNLREGQKMIFTPGPLASLLGSTRGHGILKISKRGQVYVSYHGKPRDPGYWSPA